MYKIQTHVSSLRDLVLLHEIKTGSWFMRYDDNLPPGKVFKRVNSSRIDIIFNREDKILMSNVDYVARHYGTAFKIINVCINIDVSPRETNQ